MSLIDGATDLAPQGPAMPPKPPAAPPEPAPGQAQDRTARDDSSETGDASGAIYGSFRIAASEFALPVRAIREVVNEPKTISAMPLCPPYLKGLFNLRGMIIPIVDLRVLFEFPDPKEEHIPVDGRKVAIIENGDRCIGLLFDRAGEVLNDPGAARVDFRANDGGIKDTVVDGVFKLEGGKRMVQILDPYELVRMERVPQSEASAFRSTKNTSVGSRLSCVSFHIGHTLCALDLRYVQEVREMPPVEKSLLANGYVIGTANLRGNIIPVVDFLSFMGDEPASKLSDAELTERKLLVLRTEGGLVGLMVFSIDSIIPFFEGDVLPFAKLALPRGNVVRGCLISEAERLVMLLDHDRLMAEPGLTEYARTCQELHPTQEGQASKANKKVHHDRKTFILFSFPSCFAMDTQVVSEVLNKPADLLEPPFALDFVEGIINLRGELITLINLRALYGLGPGDVAEQKVLIFTAEGQKYAVLVDSVDEIVMTSSENVSTEMTEGFGASVKLACEDVEGVLQAPREGAQSNMVLIMDPAALVRRCAVALT